MSELRLIDRGWVRVLAGLVGFAAALGAWEAVGRSGSILFLLPFSTAVSHAWTLVTGASLHQDVIPSIVRTIAGFGLGSAAGIALGIALGWFRRLEPWVRPLLEFLRATPIPAILPVAILTLGATSFTRVLLIALGAFWPVLLNAMDGTRGVDPRHVDAARVAGFGSLGILARVVWPSSLPRIFTGMRIGLAISLVMMVVSEMVWATTGLGFFVLQTQRTYNMADMYGGILTLGVVGGLFTLVFTLVERRVLAWYAGWRGMASV